MSQIFYLGLSFHFLKSRKLSCKKIVKSFPFFDIKYSRTLIQFLRHGSLPMNVIYMIIKFQRWWYDSKLIKKKEVKKWDFNLYFRENKSYHIGVYIA